MIAVMNFARIVLRAHPHARVTFAFPEEANNPQWLKGFLGADIADRADILPVDLGCDGPSVPSRKVGYFVGAPLLTKLRPSARRFYYDAVISTAFPSNPAIRAFLSWDWSRAVKRRVPLVAWSVWTATNEWQSESSSPYDNLAEICGSLACDLLVFESEKVRSDHLKTYRSYFKPTVIEQLMQRAIVAPHGVQLERIPRRRYTGQEAPHVMWSGYFKEDGEVVLPILFDALRAGIVRGVTVNAMKPELPEWVERECAANPERIRLVGRMPHEEYLRLAENEDAFLSFTHGPERTYGIRFGEIMAAGTLPVVHSEVAQTFLKRDYPFHAESPAQLRVAFWAAMAEYRRNPAIIDGVLASIEADHDAQRNMLRIYAATEALVQERIATNGYGGYAAHVQQAMAEVHGDITHAEACDRIARLTRSQTELETNALFPPGAVRWAILSQGFADVGGTEPLYRRMA
jgi:hypothetical protein